LLRALSAVTLALATMLLTAACTDGGDDGSPDQSAVGKLGSAPASGGGVAAPATLGAQQSIIATVEVQFGSGGAAFPVKAELYGPRRGQGFLTIKVRLTNLTPAGKGGSLGWQIASTFAGQHTGGLPSDVFSGVYLLDRKNSKQYLVARNAKGAFLASNELSAVFVQPQQAVEFFATFGAPPDDVSVVDVAIPRLPVFENVPIG
jgi:hypothetical protein